MKAAQEPQGARCPSCELRADANRMHDKGDGETCAYLHGRASETPHAADCPHFRPPQDPVADPVAAVWASLGKAGRDGIASAVVDMAFDVYRRGGCQDDFSVATAGGELVGDVTAPEGSLRFGFREILYWLPHVGFRVGSHPHSANFLNALDAVENVHGRDTRP